MNNERFKEIQDSLQAQYDIANSDKKRYKNVFFALDEEKELIDYITNLQENNDNQMKYIADLLVQITNLQQENERLKENNQNMQIEMAKCWQKIDKAIETLHTLNDSLPLDIILSEIEHSENILQNGSE